MRCVGYVACIDKINAQKNLAGKPNGKETMWESKG
jgi:hypothetical protein